MLISIIIRTLNEEKYLGELLAKISSQKDFGFEIETIIIDSGSTDNTIKIAKKHNCRITYIEKKNFTFGRSLNMGASFSKGDILVFISGHCIPKDDNWLTSLIYPLSQKKVGFSYGMQIGRDTTKFSERILFKKYFPEETKNPQQGFFCNNANSAIVREVWNKYKFDEEVTGLEDMELAKRYSEDGGKIAYIAEAAVYHIHDETWTQTRRRYERESIALKKIMPEIQISFLDMIRYILVAIMTDIKVALEEKCAHKEIIGIIKFRVAQFTGSYRGNHFQRVLSKRRKENYFYPNKRI